MGGIARVVLAALTVLELAACESRRQTVVLLADEDGSVGRVEVAGGGRTTTLSEANQAVAFGPKSAGEPFAMARKEVDQRFGPALAAIPEAPLRAILYFTSDTTELTADSQARLIEFLTQIGTRVAAEVEVVGHADSAGSDEYNNRLARRRAEAVRERIVAVGVEAARVQASSHGEHNPLVPTADGVAEPRNRRVEVVVR